jgi:FixJ family two-component response regulator
MQNHIYNDAKGRNVLVVEDEHTLAFALQESLENIGYEVTVAGNGEEALKCLESKNYGVVVTDLRMPGISGIELLKIIKDSFSKTEVILVTAYGTMDIAVEALRLHAFDFIMKPYPISLLQDSVRNAFENLMKIQTSTKIVRASKPVYGILTGAEKVAVSWDYSVEEEITFSLDVCGMDDSANIVFFETSSETIKRKQDILAEVRGFTRNSIFKGGSQFEIKEELKKYIKQAYSGYADWRLFAAKYDNRKELLKMSWEGPLQHVIFSQQSGKAREILNHPLLVRPADRDGEHQIQFMDRDTMLLLPARTIEYVNRYVGMSEFMTLVEKCCLETEADVAERIRESVSVMDGIEAPAILAISSKNGKYAAKGTQVRILAGRQNQPIMAKMQEKTTAYKNTGIYNRSR